MYYEEMSETKVENLPLYFSAWSPRAVESEPPLHWHEELEILHCASGEAEVVSGSHRFTLRPGETAVVNTNSLHTLYTTSSCTRYCLLIGKKLLETLECTDAVYMVFFKDDTVCELFEKMRSEFESGELMNRQSILALTIETVVRLNRAHRLSTEELPRYSAKKTQVVQQLLQYIDRHFAEDISVEQLCDTANYSRSYVMHAFKEITGHSVVEYINLRRLYNADALISSKKYTINECMYRSGFKNMSYFSKKYKELFKHSPSYREQK